MLNMDKDGRLYQSIIERNLQRMIMTNVDFVSYLKSDMVIHEIPHTDEWEQFHNDDDDLYIAVNFPKNEPVE